MAYSPESKGLRSSGCLRRAICLFDNCRGEEGISEATLRRWRRQERENGQLMPDGSVGLEGWRSLDKFAAVIETVAMNETDLSKYWRQPGLAGSL